MLDWSQWIYLGALATALVVGRPGLAVAAIMTANFAGTMALAGHPQAVGTLDLLCAALLVGGGALGTVLALFFAAMQPIYFASTLNALDRSTTYAIIDALAYGQLAAIGGWHGIGRIRRVNRASDRRGASGLRGLAAADAVAGRAAFFSRGGKG